MDLNQDTLYIFTDGSCYPNPGPGGWAALLIYNGWHKFHYGGSEGETNNTMELRAILEGLKARTDHNVRTILYTDSQYCVNALTKWWKSWQQKGWRTGTGKPVKNQPLIREILQYDTNVTYKWLKGHSGYCFNEAADMLARKGRAIVEENPYEDPDINDIKAVIDPFMPEVVPSTPPPFEFTVAEPVVERVERPSIVPASVQSPAKNWDLRDVLAGIRYMHRRQVWQPEWELKELFKEAYERADEFLAIRDKNEKGV